MSSSFTDENGTFRVVPNTVITPLPPGHQVPGRIPRRLTSIGKTVPFPCTPPCQPPPEAGYLVVRSLGSGTYGQCVLVVDLETNTEVAIKVIRARSEYLAQALLEIAVLRDAMQAGNDHTLRLLSYFYTTNRHLCLVTPLHGPNLYSALQNNDHHGFPLRFVRRICSQLFRAVSLLHELGITHLDLKPENVLLADNKAAEAAAVALTGGTTAIDLSAPGATSMTAEAAEEALNVTLIDLGSAGYISEQRPAPSQYVQSRFYRAPEVVLSLPFTAQADAWSLACVAAELFIGLPLLPGNSEYDLMRRIVTFADTPPLTMLMRSPQGPTLFSGVTNAASMYNIYRKSRDSADLDDEGAAVAVYRSLVHHLRTERPSLSASEAQRQLAPHLRELSDYQTRVRHTRVPKPRRFFKVETLDKVIHHTWQRGLRRGHEPADVSEVAGFLHLLHGMLRADPKVRWSVTDVLDHPWLRGRPCPHQTLAEWVPPSRSADHGFPVRAEDGGLPELPTLPQRSAVGSISHTRTQRRGTGARVPLSSNARMMLEIAGIDIATLDIEG